MDIKYEINLVIWFVVLFDKFVYIIYVDFIFKDVDFC